MDIWIVYHHSGEVIGVYDNEDKADEVCIALAGDGGGTERRTLNETIPA